MKKLIICLAIVLSACGGGGTSTPTNSTTAAASLTTFSEIQARPDLVQLPRITDTTNRVRVAAVQTASTKVVVFIGQSNIANFTGSGEPHTTALAGVLNFNINDGLTYVAKDPLLGSNGSAGSVPIRVGNLLITAGADRVILAPMAIGSTAVSDWASGGLFNKDIFVMVSRLATSGLVPTQIVWAQGETDAINKISTPVYESRLRSVIATFRAAGVNAPFLVTRSSYQGGAASPTLQLAYSSVVDNVSVFAGADTDLLGDNYRIGSLHFSQTGADAAAALHAAAILAL